MSSVSRRGSHRATPIRTWPRWLIGSVVVLLLAGLTVYLSLDPGSLAEETVGDVAILIAAVAAAALSTLAIRRRPDQARAWVYMSAALLMWAAGQAIFTVYGLTHQHIHPFPSLADIGFIGYALPAAIALFLFPRPRGSRVALLRTVLDATVIAFSVLFISWDIVLGPLLAVPNHDVLTLVTGLAYPIVDVVICSIVLVLTMRVPPGERLPWLFLGGGMLVLTVTDSIYVKLTFQDLENLTGTPLAVGWVLAFSLIGLATLVPQDTGHRTNPRRYALALELVPYIPVAGAIVVSGTIIPAQDVVLLTIGGALLVIIAVRQVLVVFENVTLTRELESKVAARTAELEGLAAIVNASADAIVGSDTEGVITSWNPGAERQYGYTAAEAVGRYFDFLTPGHLRDAHAAVLATIREGGAAGNYETKMARKDGSLVSVSLTVSPVIGEQGIRGIAVIGQDITARKAAEVELLNAREAALEASKLKSEFLATMSHEIRTPMNGVIGLTALLLDTPLTDMQRRYAEGVKLAGEALLTLINDILDFSKLEAGKNTLELAPFDPRILVEEVASLVAETARGKQLEFIAHCLPEVPDWLTGDAGRIRQILLNLASNALKFTESGEVAIQVGVVEQDADQAVLRFEVRDTGIGIAPEDHERLFESFSQADASTTRKYGGTGLGLAISRRLTEAMGGEIGLTSAVGEGSTFWFEIPLPMAAAPKPSKIATRNLLAGLKALIVDDNATNRFVLESQLTAWRMKSDAVADAPIGLVHAREAADSGTPYDIALIDMYMPDMDGLELARRMRADPALQDIPLMLLTSSPQISKEELAAAGIGEWLQKPIRSSELYNGLLHVLVETEVAVSDLEQEKPDESSASRGRILVVEDNEVNQMVAREMVKKLGYEVDIVANGKEAVTATDAVSYSAVLMDCHMPVMDGFEATRTITARRGRAARPPIIAMTAGALDGDRERCLAAGMDDYLAKPVELTALAQALARWVSSESGSPAEGEEPPTLSTDAGPAIDPARLADLRDLGPADGWGLLPAAVEAFRRQVPSNLAALEQALNDGGGEALAQAAHKLKGSSANIGATGAAGLCEQLERLTESSDVQSGYLLLERLRAELVLVDEALGDLLLTAP